MDPTFQAWSTLIATIIGIVISSLALMYARRIDMRQRGEELPVVNIELQRRSAGDGWANCLIHVTNRTEALWVVETVEIGPGSPRTWTGRLSPPSNKPDTRSEVEKVNADAQRGPVPLRLRLAPCGASGMKFRAQDQVHGLAVFELDPRRDRVSIRVILRSSDTSARSHTIKVYRSTAALNAAATAMKR